MKKLKKIILLLSLSSPTLAFAGGNLEIDVALSPAGSYTAKTTSVTGSAYKTAEGVEAEEVVVDLSTIETGISLRDKHTKERLGVAKYPKATLVKATGKNGKGEGLILVRGKKQKVQGTYKIEGEMLKADFPMKLSDLDIKDVRYMGVGVKDTVTVHVSVPLSGKRNTASKKK